MLQREFHQHSAEKLYLQAAKLHPNEPDAQVAAAVGRFDEDDIAAAFSHLGPLVTRFPHSQTVRYHLGLLLSWTGPAHAGGQGVHARAPARADDADGARGRRVPRGVSQEERHG